jgi:hypothetical protein
MVNQDEPEERSPLLIRVTELAKNSGIVTGVRAKKATGEEPLGGEESRSESY